MGYYEGELNVANGSNGNGFFGNDGIWAILLLSLLGFGGYGYGGIGGNRGAGSYATQADLSAGFANSEIMSDLNDILLQTSQGFAGVQQTLCQGFNGINTAILQSANATERGFAQMGYNMATCCCDLKGAIADVKYANEAQTCSIINAINTANQRLVDIYTSDKIDTLNRKLAVAEGQISNLAQTNAIVNALKQPCPIPAYTVPNPNCCYTNNCSGCGF